MRLLDIFFFILCVSWLSSFTLDKIASFRGRKKRMKMYVVRKYHGHSSWIDPKHLAEYTEAEFETRHEALAHCERLKGKGIVEIYQIEVTE